MDIIRKALLVFVLSMSLPAAALLAQTVVSRADAAAELLACLKVLGGDKAAFASGTHKFQVSRAGASGPMFKAQMGDGRLTGFECKKFTAEVTKSGGPLKFKHKDGKEGRDLTNVDLHGLRDWLALDPYWTLQRLSGVLAACRVVTDNANGSMVFRRDARVALADPVEQRYGRVEETLVVDPKAHLVLEYSVLATDAEGRAVTDLLYLYTYPASEGGKVVIVNQLSNSAPTTASTSGQQWEVRYH